MEFEIRSASLENPYTRGIAKFAANLRYEDIPPEVIERIKLLILDGIGCGIYSAQLPWSKIMAEGIRDLGSSGKSTVWGTDFKVSPDHAALANGSFVQGYELDDVHEKGGLHSSALTIPAVLALAEHRGGIAGKRFLAANVGGFEVGPRIGFCMGVRHIAQGWHTGATYGTFAAAAAAGNAIGLDEKKMIDCLGNAGSQASGITAVQYGAMFKRAQVGKASMNGVLSAILADKGYTGIANVFEAEYGGFCTTFSASKDQFNLSKLTEGLGQTWETLNYGFKVYAANARVHTSLDAIKQIRESYPLKAEEVEKVIVRGATTTYNRVGWPYKPDGIAGAQFNIPYSLAAMLLEGHAFIDQYTEEKIRDPKIVELSKRVEVIPDPVIDAEVAAQGSEAQFQAKVEVRLKDGRSFRLDVLRRPGSKDRPLSSDDVVAKFKLLASKVLDDKRMQRIMDRVMGLEKLGDASVLAQDLVLP